jgi:target of rapamycin complex 2 subunit MAPKAP1
VVYQLRSSYLDDIADGVGERLITLNDSFVNSAAFKAAGWRTNPALAKRTHSPPIPTAITAEYFQAPRAAGLTLEDEAEDGGMLTGGGADTLGPGMATKRRRRRAREMEEDDSSDLSDESDDESDQRAAQQIKFAKMPLRSRAGSSPLQSSTIRQTTAVSSPRSGPGARRGSQSALEVVKERARRDTVTSSEVSSENEFEHRHRDAARAAARSTAKLQSKLSDPIPGIRRQDTSLLPEEEEESDAESDTSGPFVESLDSPSILDTVENNGLPMQASPRAQVVGTPPRAFARTSTIRKSQAPPRFLGSLPPPRPLSTIRPLSMIQPTSLLSEALQSKKSKSKPVTPFQRFATLSGEGDRKKPILLNIYAPSSNSPDEPFEVLIRRDISDDASGNPKPVTVTDLIGLSLLRYIQEKREPPLPADKHNVNWWTLRMVEEGGEVDYDFPPLDRKSSLASFTTANNRAAAAAASSLGPVPGRGAGRIRANSKVKDDFALVMASDDEHAKNKRVTPEFEEEDEEDEVETPMQEQGDQETTPKNTPQPESVLPPMYMRPNPVTNTTYRPGGLLDQPQVAAAAPNTSRGQSKLLRVNILSSDTAPGQLVTLDVTTDTYMAEVLDLVCRKRQLDKANHVLKIPPSGTVVKVDRPVSSLGGIAELELHRRRFATDGPLNIGSPSSSSPKLLPFADMQPNKKGRREKLLGAHPLAQEAMKQDELNSANYKKYTVWRKQPMRLVGTSERLLVIDGEYIHIMAGSGGKPVEGGSKSTTYHFSNVVGCKVTRKHPTNFKVRVAGESAEPPST